MIPKNRLFGPGGFEKTKGGKLTLDQIIARRQKVNETAKKHVGVQVSSIYHLQLLAERKRSVFHAGCWGRGLLPAIVVMNMSASMVLSIIDSGRLFEYEKPTKHE